jgi:DNA segregation ATPase FtsK/SpoIIIE, S-DNA-T family
VASRVAELLAVIAQRQEVRSLNAHSRLAADVAGGRELPWYRTEIMVVLDGARKLRSLPGVIQLLREGPGVGVYVVCVDGDERLLPGECQAVAAIGPDGLRVQQPLAAAVSGAQADQVSPGWCTQLARSIAPIRDVSTDEDTDGIPDSARLLDILGLDVRGPDMAPAITARWRACGRSTVAVVGVSYDGPLGIDIKKDGPHGLIAGTTGSGKSELLQTLVASLAAVNRPDELTFVLIDYKGGSAFADCARLPHTVGMVTDLSPHLVERALTSLSAELTRREHLLAAVGAKDIEDYQHALDKTSRRPGGTAAHARAMGTNPAATRSRDGTPMPLPRLVIVIDEFASLLRDLPDFVTGLVNIAQRGRSLGIHLLLATQRPSGVVSADIRANTNLRIALRVTDRGESSDVIDAPDAASITKATPGRAYVRLGHASLVPFQAGQVSGPYTAGMTARDATARTATGTWLAPLTWADLGRPEPVPPPCTRPADEEITDLKMLVEQIRLAAAALDIPAQSSPWLHPLPTAVQLSTLWPTGTTQLTENPGLGGRGGFAGPGALEPGWRATTAWDQATVPFGIADLPARQAQELAGLSLTAFTHLMAAGAPRSGRSQLLRTIAGALALAHSCADVHLYGLDCGNGALLPLTGLPHCGAVVSRTEAERAARLLRRMDAELTRRQELLAAGGFASITEQRAATSQGTQSGPRMRAHSGPHGDDMPLAHVFLLLDRWEGFTTSLGEADGGALTDVVTRVLSEGASAGVHLIMTGDRSLLAGRISSLCEEKLVFKLADREDYALAGLRGRDLPGDVPPGRAFRAGSGTEIQAALLGPDATGQGQAAALQAIAEVCVRRDDAVPVSSRPFRVDAAPGRIYFEQAWALRSATALASASPSGLWGLVGVGGDSLQALGPDLGKGLPAFIVAGPNGSGRSTILVAMARSFLAAGTRVVIAAPRPSPLRSLAEAAGVERVFTEDSLEEEELAAALASVDGPCVVLVDDAELLRDCDASAELSRILASPGRGLVIAGDPEAGLCAGFGGWQIDVKRARRGCLTAPTSPGDGDLIGVRLTRGQVGQPARPGRCLLNTGDGRLITVTVPSADHCMDLGAPVGLSTRDW